MQARGGSVQAGLMTRGWAGWLPLLAQPSKYLHRIVRIHGASEIDLPTHLLRPPVNAP